MGSADFLIYFSYSNYYIKNSAFWQRKIIVDLAVFACFLRDWTFLASRTMGKSFSPEYCYLSRLKKGAAVWYNHNRIRLYPACLTSRKLSGEKGQRRAQLHAFANGGAAICPVPLGAGFCLISPYTSPSKDDNAAASMYMLSETDSDYIAQAKEVIP